MLSQLKKFLNNPNGLKILELVVTIIIAYFTAKITAKNSRKNLTTQYFKEKGIETQEKILKFWSNLFMDKFDIKESYNDAFHENIDDDVHILNLINKESYIYCSAKTIKAIKDYQQYVYKINDNKHQKTSLSPMIQIALITRIISRMKYDFTGEKVHELDLLQIKIKDLKFFHLFIYKFIIIYANLKDIILNF